MKIATHPALFCGGFLLAPLVLLTPFVLCQASRADAVASRMQTVPSLSLANAIAGNGKSANIAACSANKEQRHSLASNVSKPDI